MKTGCPHFPIASHSIRSLFRALLGHFLFFGGDSIQAQTWTLEKQLRAGLRAFDLHFIHQDGVLRSFIGVDQGSNIEDVEKTFSIFLKTHPGEFILLNIQEIQSPVFMESLLGNNLSSGKPRKFSEEIKYKIDWADCFWRKIPKKIPKISQLRGKIILLHGVYGIPDQLLFKIPNQQLKKANTVFDLQNVWEQRKQHLKQPLGKRIRITEISASESGCYPHTAAKNLNAWFLTNMGKFPKPFGVVMFYFPGTGIIKNMIESNQYKSNLKLDNASIPLLKGKFGSDGGTFCMEFFLEDIRTLTLETRYSEDSGLIVTAFVINSQRIGVEGGDSSQSLTFGENEYISKISGYSGWCIQCFDIHTSKGNRLCAGSGEGEYFSIHVGKGDKVALLYSENYLHSIFVFDTK